MTMARTGPLAFGLKPGSIEPSALRRARLLRASPLTVVNWPPMSPLPSAWVARTKTFPSTSGLKPSTAEGVWANRAPAKVKNAVTNVRAGRANIRENEASSMEKGKRAGGGTERNVGKKGEIGRRAAARQ